MHIYLLEGNSFFVPGHFKSAHATLESLNKEAAELVNILREEVDLDNSALPENWREKLLETRKHYAEEHAILLDEVKDGNVWFTELEVSGIEADAALSAQVQDVAGWHARCGDLLCLIADLTESDGELFDRDDREKINAIDADWRAGYDADNTSSRQIGWQLVPKQPTEDMLDAALAVHEVREGEDEEFLVEFKRTYRAMLAAAPAKQEGGK